MVTEPFLDFDEDVGWWEPAPEPRAPPPRPRVRARRPPPRTLAGDLARLRGAIARSPGVAGLVLLGALLAVAFAVRVATGGDGGAERAAKPPLAPPPAAAEPAVPAAEAPVPAGPARPLRSGDRGAAVRDLQTTLAALGYADAAPDGAFGPATASAVAAFQAASGLLADGIAGSATFDALRAGIADRAAPAAVRAEEGLDRALRTGRLGTESAERYRAALDDARSALTLLSPGRSAAIGAVLGTVGEHADLYDPARALALFSMLEANTAHLSGKALPKERFADIVGADGAVYRYMPGHGFQFHPLANAARLNALARREKTEEARSLADALAARSVREGRGIAWEYYFPFGGPSRWTSALAQAVAAQALARASLLIDDPRALTLARGAFRTLPGELSRPVEGGTWVREYGYSDMAVLNAQLQSLVSVSEYVELSGDEQARAFGADLAAASRTLLPRFDTGCWSLYALDGNPATPHYHAYHVSLLNQLARSTGEAIWAETAARWRGYERVGGC